jgi:peptide/nickel transport system permease protein
MVFILLSIVFVVLRVLPGDPVTMLEGKDIPEEVLQRRREELGLNKPIHEQYLSYLINIFQGNLGETALTKVPATYFIIQRLPATVELAIMSMIFAVIIGIFLGSYGAYKFHRPLSYIVRIYGMIVYSIPVFFLGLLLIYILSISLGIFPTSLRLSPLLEIEYSTIRVTNFILIDSIILNRYDILYDWLHHLFLPSLVLGIYLSGIFVRLTHAQVAETLFKDFVTAARARGITERRILYKYGLRNALIPIVTMMGLQFAALLSGAVLTETVFNWPGIGSLVYESILARDYNLVQGSIVIYAFLVALVSLIVDITYAYIDPRIRY